MADQPSVNRAGQDRTLRSLLDSVNDLVWCTSVDGTELIYVNPATERIYGRPLADLIENQDVWAEAIHPDDRATVEKNLSTLMDKRQVQQEYRIIRPNGEVRWIQDRINVVYDDDGEPMHVGGIGTDITEKKRSESRYRELFENANDLIYTSDLEGRFTSLNKTGEEMIGYTREEIIGSGVAALVAPEFLDMVREMTRRKMSTRERTTYQIEIVAKDGSRIPVEVGSRLIYDKGEPVAIQGIVRDISERKRAEEQLRAAKDAADAANRAKSDFLANMSHEIRTPMNAVIGMTELLLDTPLDDSQREYVRMVHESGESLLELINDILDFSKIEAGKLEFERLAFSLHESLGDTMKSLALRAHRKRLELAYHIHPDVPDNLLGDPGRLRQVIVNLVGNAIKFTDEGEVVVAVTCETHTDDDALLHFAVTDTGIGIAEDKLDHIFGAFDQADTSTTRRFGGTGLGLAISTRIAQHMGGRMWVESELGAGSTFQFTAKFERSRGEHPARPQVRLEEIAGMRVLVVDDNATNRRILEEMLRIRGMRPVVASSAAEALQFLHDAHEAGREFRLVLTDVHMPDVDGITLAEQIKQDAELGTVTIMVLTSGDRPGDRTRCQEIGVAAHLMKPIKQSELVDAIVLAFDIQTPESDEIASEKSPTAAAVRPLRILLAEDALANQMLAVGLLKKGRHTVTVANNGKEAVAMLQSQPFDLVLMDVQMPEMDGLEATAVIRRIEAEGKLSMQPRVPIPIVAMTAHALKGDRERCLDAGMDAYVSKPIRVRELYAAIASFYSEPAEQDVGDASSTEQPGSPPEDLMDWSVALHSVEGDAELLKAVAGAFLTECPLHRHDLQAAVEAGDSATIERVAHSMRSVMMTFGAQRGEELVARLESMGNQSNLSEAAACARSFCEFLDEWTALLNAFVNDEFTPPGA